PLRVVSSCRNRPVNVEARRRGSPLRGSRSVRRSTSLSVLCRGPARAAPTWVSPSRHRRTAISHTTRALALTALSPRRGTWYAASGPPRPTTSRPTAGTGVRRYVVPNRVPPRKDRRGVPGGVRRTGTGPPPRSPRGSRGRDDAPATSGSGPVRWVPPATCVPWSSSRGRGTPVGPVPGHVGDVLAGVCPLPPPRRSARHRTRPSAGTPASPTVCGGVGSSHHAVDPAGRGRRGRATAWSGRPGPVRGRGRAVLRRSTRGCRTTPVLAGRHGPHRKCAPQRVGHRRV